MRETTWQAIWTWTVARTWWMRLRCALVDAAVLLLLPCLRTPLSMHCAGRRDCRGAPQLLHPARAARAGRAVV